jgi:Ca-activated chloride channel family protein
VRRLIAAALLTLTTLAPAVARADGMIIIERPPRPTPNPTVYGFPLSVKDHHVTVSINGPIATTTVDQTFGNSQPYELEGTYVFPLPEDAAVDKFSMWIDGKETEAELLDAGKARSIYEGIVRSMRDPALVEYMGRGMFRARIFPIPANGEKRVKISYAQVLKNDAGMVRYRYPLATEKHSATPLDKVSISLEVEQDRPIKAVYSPWQELDIRRSGDKKLKASWEASHVKIDRDFLMAFALDDSDVSMSVLTYAKAIDDEGGTFLLLIAPKVELKPEEVQPKDVVFVLDTSGSMQEQGKIDQARRALRYCVQRLDPQDRFGLIDFSTDVRFFKDNLSPANDANKNEALEYIKNLKARGGTALEEALVSALKMRSEPDPKRSFQVVFLTDGEPTIGTTDPDAILKNAAKASEGKGARVFVFGVGADVNAPLLDKIAETQRGDREYVLPGEDIEISMSSFYDKVSAPVLSDLELTFEGDKVRLAEMYPSIRKLPDLFRGTQIAIAGRFSGEGPVTAKLTGNVNGTKREFKQALTFARSSANGFLPRIWAQRKIGFLLDEIRLHGETTEVKDEVVRLARAFGIPTPYTSWLVVDEKEIGRRRNGPVPLAPGAADQGFRALRKAADEPRAGFGGDGTPNSAPAPAAAKPEEYKSGGSIAKKETTGEEAAKDAKRITGLEKTDKDSDEARSRAAGLSTETIKKIIQQVGAKTFYNADGVWVDSLVDDAARKSAKKVTYLSDDYFALLKAHEEGSPFFALGSKVVVKLGAEVFEISE